MTNSEIAGWLGVFRGEVLCRRESNQFAARKIWDELKQHLTVEEIEDISDWWIHYKIEDLQPDDFGTAIKKIEGKYETAK